MRRNLAASNSALRRQQTARRVRSNRRRRSPHRSMPSVCCGSAGHCTEQRGHRWAARAPTREHRVLPGHDPAPWSTAVHFRRWSAYPSLVGRLPVAVMAQPIFGKLVKCVLLHRSAVSPSGSSNVWQIDGIDAEIDSPADELPVGSAVWQETSPLHGAYQNMRVTLTAQYAEGWCSASIAQLAPVLSDVCCQDGSGPNCGLDGEPPTLCKSPVLTSGGRFRSDARAISLSHSPRSSTPSVQQRSRSWTSCQQRRFN